MEYFRLKHKSDIRHLLEVKNAQPRRRQGSVGSDGSDASDLSTQSMPQYSSYRYFSLVYVTLKPMSYIKNSGL